MEEFQTAIARLIGKKVKKVGAGGSTGSMFTLDFWDGNEIAESRSPDCLMVKCSWRLEDILNVKTITGWQEDSSLQGALTFGLKSLTDDTIAKVDLTAFNDLAITFKSGKRLSLFCDITENVSGDFNWFLGTKDGYYSIDTRLKLDFEKK
ncbi:MAG TPA: hypothetical protein VGD65_03280 [Chryseosolibacter sp.]